MEFVVYELVHTPPFKVLPRLLEKMLEQGQKSVIHLAHTPQVEELNQALWTYHLQSFLPHGSAQDGSAEDQPVWLTDTLENPNQASVYIHMHDPRAQGPAPCTKSVFLFDTSHTALKKSAWDVCATLSPALSWTWWRQADQGKWERQHIPAV